MASTWGTAVTMPHRSDHGCRLIRADGGPATLAHTQGIAFSPTGTVYTTRYVERSQNLYWTNYVQVFSSLTGKRFSDDGAGIRRINFAEIEGAAFHSVGAMYLAAVAHDFPGKDSYDLYTFRSEGDRPCNETINGA